MDDDPLMLLPEVLERTRLSEQSFRWLIHKGTAPRHGKIGRRLVWRRSEVERWIDDAFQRDGRPAA